MSLDRLRPFFAPPSAGDRLLAAASSAKLELHRYPDEARAGEEPPCDVSFELRGSLPITGGTAAGLVRDLLREFRAPKPGQRPEQRGEEGGAE